MRWSGFEHPHEEINFTICVSNTTTESDFMVCDQSASANKHTFSDLDLKPYQVDNTEFNLKNNIFDGNVLFDIFISKATNKQIDYFFALFTYPLTEISLLVFLH